MLLGVLVNGLGCGSGFLILLLCGVVGYRLSVRGYVPKGKRDPSSMTVEAWEHVLRGESGEELELRWLEKVRESRFMEIARALNDSSAQVGSLQILVRKLQD